MGFFFYKLFLFLVVLIKNIYQPIRQMDAKTVVDGFILIPKGVLHALRMSTTLHGREVTSVSDSCSGPMKCQKISVQASSATASLAERRLLYCRSMLLQWRWTLRKLNVYTFFVRSCDRHNIHLEKWIWFYLVRQEVQRWERSTEEVNSPFFFQMVEWFRCLNCLLWLYLNTLNT